MAMNFLDVNVGNLERGVRVLGGGALVTLAALGTLPAWAFIGAVPLLTGLSGRCPAYSLFGFSTCPMKAAPEPPPGT